jgi:hypothetical protein
MQYERARRNLSDTLTLLGDRERGWKHYICVVFRNDELLRIPYRAGSVGYPFLLYVSVIVLLPSGAGAWTMPLEWRKIVDDGRVIGASRYSPCWAGNPLFQDRHDVALV